jgi:hypothetical protein
MNCWVNAMDILHFNVMEIRKCSHHPDATVSPHFVELAAFPLACVEPKWEKLHSNEVLNPNVCSPKWSQFDKF